jgi:predicted metal-binding membrane protein
MMAAMMMPTIVPTLQVYDDLPISGRAGWLGLIAGYGAVWLIGSAVFAGMQVVLMGWGWIDLAGAATSWWLTAGLFAVAGAWQFTRRKTVCQDACLSPMQYFLTNWKPGGVGGWQMGVEIGLVCVGCCWAIMTLGFVGGAMSLLWMGLATMFMVIEKLPDIGQHVRRPAGLALLGAFVFCVFQAI